MKAHLNNARIAPKKANIIAKMVRGMSVQEAITALERTHKKAARLVEQLLKSAVANAEHNDKKSTSSLMIGEIVVNQGAAYRRGVPMARGRVRPMKKFLSHIRVTLVIPGDTPKMAKQSAGTASQNASDPVKENKPKGTKTTSKAKVTHSSSESAA